MSRRATTADQPKLLLGRSFYPANPLIEPYFRPSITEKSCRFAVQKRQVLEQPMSQEFTCQLRYAVDALFFCVFCGQSLLRWRFHFPLYPGAHPPSSRRRGTMADKQTAYLQNNRLLFASPPQLGVLGALVVNSPLPLPRCLSCQSPVSFASSPPFA
jgi:hypothetical protein